jgi:hypothetical protein
MLIESAPVDLRAGLSGTDLSNEEEVMSNREYFCERCSALLAVVDAKQCRYDCTRCGPLRLTWYKTRFGPRAICDYDWPRRPRPAQLSALSKKVARAANGLADLRDTLAGLPNAVATDAFGFREQFEGVTRIRGFLEQSKDLTLLDHITVLRDVCTTLLDGEPPR